MELVVQLVAPTRISLSAKKKKERKKKKGRTRQDKTRVASVFFLRVLADSPLDELETEENRGPGAFT
jgi:hypothetical protein